MNRDEKLISLFLVVLIRTYITSRSTERRVSLVREIALHTLSFFLSFSRALRLSGRLEIKRQSRHESALRVGYTCRSWFYDSSIMCIIIIP